MPTGPTAFDISQPNLSKPKSGRARSKIQEHCTMRPAYRTVQSLLYTLFNLSITAALQVDKCFATPTYDSEVSGTPNGFDFILDSGASRHFCNDLSRMHNIQNAFGQYVKVANGKRIRIEKVGDMHVVMYNQYGERISIVLKNVAYVPSFSHSLVSIRKLWKDNRIKTKFGGKNLLKDLDGNKFSFSESCGLYKAVAFVADSSPDVVILHERLGHCGQNKMGWLAENTFGLSIPKDVKLPHTCEACQEGGAVKHPAHASTEEFYTEFGDKVSTDLIDMLAYSHDGYRYAICFVDRATRYVHVDFLRTKSSAEVREALQRFEKKFRAHLPNGHIKRWHCDNGGEFMSENLNDFCEEFAIRRSFSVPYRPESNAQAERVWGVLLRRIRTMHAKRHTDDRFWSDSMRQAMLFT